MPVNQKHLLFDTLPSFIFIDTNLIVYAQSGIKRGLHIKDEYKILAAKIFIKRLKQSDTKIYFSALLFPEYWRAVMEIEVIKRFNLSEREAKRKIKQEGAPLIKSCFPAIRKADDSLDALMGWFQQATDKKDEVSRLRVVETEELVMEQAFAVIKKYGLDTYDAIHIGSMLRGEFKDFATFDDGIIKNCKDLNIWCGGADSNSIVRYAKKQNIDYLYSD